MRFCSRPAIKNSAGRRLFNGAPPWHPSSLPFSGASSSPRKCSSWALTKRCFIMGSTWLVGSFRHMAWQTRWTRCSPELISGTAKANTCVRPIFLALLIPCRVHQDISRLAYCVILWYDTMFRYDKWYNYYGMHGILMVWYNNVPVVKIGGPVWYTIYHHLPLVKGVNW